MAKRHSTTLQGYLTRLPFLALAPNMGLFLAALEEQKFRAPFLPENLLPGIQRPSTRQSRAHSKQTFCSPEAGLSGKRKFLLMGAREEQNPDLVPEAHHS